MWTPDEVIRQYERGNLAEGEKFFLLAQAITEQNAARFIASLPAELMEELRRYIDGCPRTDNDWAKVRFFRIASWVRAPSPEVIEAERAAELRLHRQGVEILRDVVGPRVAIAPLLLAWQSATIPKLAQVIHDERRWEDMPILADALEEAGCDNEEILGHLRRQGQVHVPGCWVIDLLLNKN
jgi:hypothetical protein